LKYKFIINGNAGNGSVKKHIEFIISKLKKHFIDFDYCVTTKLSDLDQCLNSIDKYDGIIAIGGDGTINGILNKIIEEDKALGIIPFGSGNDFIHALNIPHNFDESLEIIRRNYTKKIDVGLITSNSFQKYFLNAVGIGFDAMVAHKTNKIKFVGSSFRYYLALIESLFTYKPKDIEITIDGNIIRKKVFLLTIGNGQRTGGAFILTPGALLDDSFFELCIVDEVSIPIVLTALPKVLKGSHGSMKQVQFFKAASIKVRSENDLYLHYDGETPGYIKEAEITIIPHKLSVICP
jgi:diacylglycerol kinase (ATP)